MVQLLKYHKNRSVWMSIKSQILSMDKFLVDKEYIEEGYIENIEELLLTVETTTSVYDMCCYLYEDCDWVTFLVLMDGFTQCTSIKKEEIVTIGIYNGLDSNLEKKTDIINTNMYQ